MRIPDVASPGRTWTWPVAARLQLYYSTVCGAGRQSRATGPSLRGENLCAVRLCLEVCERQGVNVCSMSKARQFVFHHHASRGDLKPDVSVGARTRASVCRARHPVPAPLPLQRPAASLLTSARVAMLLIRDAMRCDSASTFVMTWAGSEFSDVIRNVEYEYVSNGQSR